MEETIKNNVWLISNKNVVVKKLEKTKFANPFSENEQKKLLELMGLKNDSYNGVSVRLDRVTEKNFEISKVGFFDFILTNNLYHNRKKFLNYSICNSDKVALVNKIINIVEINGLNDFSDVVDNSNLANIIAVSILIEDKNGNVGIVKRSKNVLISSGFFSSTVTGSLNEQDFKNRNPLLACAKREIEEELGLTDIELQYKSIVMSKKKLQPIVLYNAKLNVSWEDIIKDIKNAKEYSSEINIFYSVPVINIKDFMFIENFTDAVKYHLCLKYKEKYEDIEKTTENIDNNKFIL